MKVIRALKTVNYRLFDAIFLTLLLPTVYQTVRIFFLGAMPGDLGLNIASQLSWVNLFYEVIQEALILPIFFLLGKSLQNKDELVNKIRGGLVVTAAIYSVLSGFLAVFARPLVVFMAQDSILVDATVTYVRLETIAALFLTLWRFMALVFITLKKDIYLYITLGVQLFLSVLLDTFLISTLPVSANIGVNGIAISNIIVNLTVFALSIILLSREQIQIFKRTTLSFRWMKEWFQVGKYSGLESLLRNLTFMVIIIRMVNVVAEQGIYWIANTFIWQWLLLPALALADLVKKEIAEDKNNIRNKTFGYIMLTILFAVIWLATIPLWKPFLKHIMNIADYETVFSIVLLQTGFYITFLFNTCIFDSTFYGTGKTKYMFIQSICINGLYYGCVFVFYIMGVFKPTLGGISLVFGIGMMLDFIPSLILYLRLLKKEHIHIDFNLEEENSEKKIIQYLST